MNLAERAEDIDYQPDVMKLKQIWKEMEKTDKERNDSTSKIPVRDQPQQKNKNIINKKKEALNKQALMSKKNVTRNPKPDYNKVIQFETQPQGYYVDNLKNQKNNMNPETLLQMATSINPVGEINDLKRKIQEKDYELSLLRVSNTRNQDKLLSLQNQLEKKDERISMLHRRERELLSQIACLGDKEMIFDYGKVEYQNFKNDTRRLLKMLQTTSEYQQFSNIALEDNGVRFLHAANQKFKSHLDQPKKTVLHFCTCNKDFIPESGFWVPQKVYSFGKQFLKERKGQLSFAQLELLLYELNKMWRQREKRILNTINSQKAKEIEKLKRKVSNMHLERIKK